MTKNAQTFSDLDVRNGVVKAALPYYTALPSVCR